jgi:hypothetical protein
VPQSEGIRVANILNGWSKIIAAKTDVYKPLRIDP